jgi:hypothetical protein
LIPCSGRKGPLISAPGVAANSEECKEAKMSKKGGNKPKATPKPEMQNKGPKKK